MGFLLGSSCFPHCPQLYHHSLCSPFSSQFSSSSSFSLLLLSCRRNVTQKKRATEAMAGLHRRDQHLDDTVFCKRRVILLMGISVLPLLNLRARAFEEFEMIEQDQKRDAEQTHQGDALPNPFVSFLNGIGILSSSVLGALFALARKEKATDDAVIESLKYKLEEKEAAVVSLEKNFQSALLSEKEERNKLQNKANEEHESLLNQLKSADSAITSLGQELRKEKKSAEELVGQMHRLQNDLTEAERNRKDLEGNLKEKLDSIEVLQGKINLLSSEVKNKEEKIHDLSLKRSEKETEFENLNSLYEQAKDQVKGLKSEIEELKTELSKTEKELNLRYAAVDDLNLQLTALLVERDDLKRKVEAIQAEYGEFKSSSEIKAAVNAKLLEEKEEKLHQFEEQLKFTLQEMSRNEVCIADLTQEKDDLQKRLDAELENVRSQERELLVMQENLDKSKDDTSSLEKQLEESRSLYSQLEADLSKVQTEFTAARESLQRNLDEAKENAEQLSGELTLTKKLLEKTKEDLQTVSNELEADVESRNNLQKELVDVYKKAESTASDLKEEKRIVISLNRELKTWENQALKDKEARKSLEKDLEEATQSLDDMNKKALVLSNHLELANSTISSLQNEKEALYGSLAEQEQLTQETHSLAMSLGKERDGLEKRAKKLEEELASAKGEILRLRSRINSTRAMVNESEEQNSVDEGDNVAVAAKKRGRRRKTVN